MERSGGLISASQKDPSPRTWPVVIVQAESFNRSRLRTVTVAVVTSNLKLAQAPGNVLIRGRRVALQREFVVNVSAVVTLDREALERRGGRLTVEQMREVDDGLRLALSL